MNLLQAILMSGDISLELNHVIAGLHGLMGHALIQIMTT
jgi:hypothetical protein